MEKFDTIPNIVYGVKPVGKTPIRILEASKRWRQRNPSYIKEWREKNKDRINKRILERYNSDEEYHNRRLEIGQKADRKRVGFVASRARKQKEEFVKRFGGRCMDCGTIGPPPMFHFDHRDRGTKEFNLGVCFGRKKIEVIEAEIAKCDMVCANCHAIRTWVKED